MGKPPTMLNAQLGVADRDEHTTDCLGSRHPSLAVLDRMPSRVPEKANGCDQMRQCNDHWGFGDAKDKRWQNAKLRTDVEGLSTFSYLGVLVIVVTQQTSLA